MAKDAKPGDPAVYMTLAGYYNRQGQFDKTIEALKERAAKEPNNPEAYLHDLDVLLGQGLPQHPVEGTEKKIVRRLGDRGDRSRAHDQAGLHRSARLQEPAAPAPGEHGKGSGQTAALLKQADQLRDKAQELRKTKAAGVGD